MVLTLHLYVQKTPFNGKLTKFLPFFFSFGSALKKKFVSTRVTTRHAPDDPAYSVNFLLLFFSKSGVCFD